MDLEKLQQEAEKLKSINPSSLNFEQLSEFLEKLANLINQSEESLATTSLTELNINENESNESDDDL